jgi:lincosamide nucleotidyltransferase B/F
MYIAELRKHIRQQLVEAAGADGRIVGLVDYGSSSEGRGDDWSDLDVAVFVGDEDLAAFEAEWQQWAGQFGRLLLAYIGGIGHPWVVYDAEPIPLRADFAFVKESAAGQLVGWPNSPVSVEAMVLYDGMDGRLSAYAARLVGKSLAPDNLQVAFEQVCGDFYYYLLRTFTKLRRGQAWAARHDFNFVIMGNLLALLRLESGAVEHWQGASAAAGIEQVISLERLHQLQGCIPAAGEVALLAAMQYAAGLGEVVCRAIAAEHGWAWPAELAERVQVVLGSPHVMTPKGS